MAETGLPKDIVLRVPHDLRAPLVNIRGFAGELDGAIERLVALVERHQHALPSDFRDGVSALVNEDLNPCLEYLGKATQQLDKRIEEIAQLIAAERIGGIEEEI